MNEPSPRKKPSRRAPVAAAVVILFASGLAFGFSRGILDSFEWKERMKASVIDPSFVEKAPEKASPIPDFSLPDRGGRPVKLSDFAAVETLVVNIWSTDCPTCEQELPSLAEMDRRIGTSDKVQLLTITIDASWDAAAHLFPRGTDLRILFDPDRKVTRDIFSTVRYPETFVLDKKRRIRARFDGGREWHSDEMIQYLSSLR